MAFNIMFPAWISIFFPFLQILIANTYNQPGGAEDGETEDGDGKTDDGVGLIKTRRERAGAVGSGGELES